MRVLVCLPLFAGWAVAAPLPEAVTRELCRGASLPEADYALARAWECEGPENHMAGHREADPDASQGAAWALDPGERSFDAAVYGPYIELEPGHYVALFRLKLTETADDDVVCRIDSAVGTGSRTLSSKEVYAGDLTVGAYRLVALPIEYPGGRLECRVYWTGLTPLRVDCIQLYRVTGNVDFAPAMVPQPRSTGEPRDLPYAAPPPSYETLFPRAQAPAPKLVVADLRAQTNDLRAALLTVQGLVNRTTPSVYCLCSDIDQQWLDWMTQRGYVTETELLADPTVLFQRHADLIKGAVIIDARLPATKNIAYLIAALESGLPATPSLARKLGLPVIADLRGRFATNAEAYRWAFEQYWPRCNHQVIACLWPDNTDGLRDYLVQNNVFCFWLGGRLDGTQPGGSSQADLETIEALMAEMPTNIPVLGYPWNGVDVGIGEHDGVQSFARYAKFLVGSIGVTNASLMSGYPLPEMRQARPAAPALEEGKVYVTWVMSDGDNLPVLSRGNFPQLWADRHRGEVPMAWSLSPSAPLLMPPVVDYYYRTAKPGDCFIGAVSGIGYTYPEDYAERYVPEARGRLYDEFLDLTATGMERCDLRQIWIMGIDPGPMIRRYAEKIPTLDGMFPDYGRRLTRYDAMTYATARGVPVFHAVTNWAENDDHDGKVGRVLNQVRDTVPAEGTAFLHLFIWNWGADMSVYAEVMRKLGPRFVAVRPDQLAALARQYYDQQQILVRKPDGLIAVEGRPASCRLRIDNTLGRPLDYRASVTGLDGAALQPATGTLPGHDGVDLTLTGTAAGAAASIRIEGPFGSRDVGIPLRTIPRAEVLGELPAGALAFVDRFEAAGLSHHSGTPEEDAAAIGGRAWVARPGATASGHIAYGPYRPTPAGRYLALFRLRRFGTGDGSYLTLDAHLGGGDDLEVVQVSVADVPEGGYRCVPLVFDHPGGQLETRVFWSGRAGVALDSVLLFGVEDGR